MPAAAKIHEFATPFQRWVRPVFSFAYKTQRPAPVAVCACGGAFLRDIGQPTKLCRACRKKRNVEASAASQRALREAHPETFRAYHAAKTRAYRAKYPERKPAYDARASRARKLNWKFGVSIERYESMLSEQDGVCAICLKTDRTGRRLAVDHCHATGAVRGLLCAMCNTAIGKLGDSPELLRKALAYLEKCHA